MGEHLVVGIDEGLADRRGGAASAEQFLGLLEVRAATGWAAEDRREDLLQCPKLIHDAHAVFEHHGKPRVVAANGDRCGGRRGAQRVQLRRLVRRALVAGQERSSVALE